MTVHRFNISEDDLKNISKDMEQLARLPEQRINYSSPDREFSLTKFGIVTYLQDQINELMSRGWTIQEIVNLLAEKGVEISISTLTTYLHRLKHK